MESYSDKFTGEKVYVYHAPDISLGMDYRASALKARVISGLQADGDRLTCKLGGHGTAPYDSMNFKSIHYFRNIDKTTGEERDMIFGVNENGHLAHFSLDSPATGAIVEAPIFNEAPVFINYNYNGTDFLVINGKSDGFYYFTGNMLYSIGSNPNVTGAAIYDNKLFACSTENYPRVKFMNLSNPDSWSVVFTSLLVYNECGMVRSLATMGSAVYVFHENGISKITKAGDDDYSVSKVWQTGEMIFGDTVKVCGNVIYFCTNAGIYCFDGSKVKRAFETFNGLYLPSPNARIVSADRKIYVALNVDATVFGGENDDFYYSNNALIVYDEECDVAWLYYGIAIESFCLIPKQNKILAALPGFTVEELDDSGVLGGKTIGGYYRLGESKLGTGKRKNIRKIEFVATHGAHVTLMTDGVKSEFDVPASDKKHVLRVGKTALTADVIIKATGGAIGAVEIHYSEAE